MSNIPFRVPKLVQMGCWIDDRGRYGGGYGWRGDRRVEDIKVLYLHHTATYPSFHARTDINTVDEIHEIRGFGGIGYNIIVTSEEKKGYAVASYTGDLLSIRAHTANKKGSLGIPARLGNVYGIGICIVGYFTNNRQPTNSQARSVKLIVDELLKDFPGVKAWGSNNTLNTVGHKIADFTTCPSDNYTAFYKKAKSPPKLIDKEEEMYKKKYNDLKKKYDKLIKDKQKVETKLKNAQKQIKELESELEMLRKTTATLSEKVEALEKTVEIKNTKIKNQTTQLNACENKVSKYKVEIDNLNEKLKKCEGGEQVDFVGRILNKLKELWENLKNSG